MGLLEPADIDWRPRIEFFLWANPSKTWIELEIGALKTRTRHEYSPETIDSEFTEFFYDKPASEAGEENSWGRNALSASGQNPRPSFFLQILEEMEPRINPDTNWFPKR